MRLFERSLPMTKPAADGGLEFCTLREKLSAVLNEGPAKVLLVSDEVAFPAAAFAARMPRTVSSVGTDALPLFSLPEAACVVGVGGGEVMRAARLYAAVKRTPCVLFPSDCGLDGVFCGTGARVKGEFFAHPLAAAEVCIDEKFVAPTRAEGYARLLLCRLALFEQRALRRFDGGAEPSEAAFRILMDLGGETDVREIVLKNAALRRMDAPEGEGAILASSCGNFAAFEALIALYVAFFRCGEPRRYTVPDYEMRARVAGMPFAKLHLPTEEDHARRALVLGGRRADFLRELDLITRKNDTYRRIYRSLGGEIVGAPRGLLKTLPERSNGLSAVIRDFGLMEKL